MGWISTSVSGKFNTEQFLKAELERSSDPEVEYIVLEHCMIGSVLYAAVEQVRYPDLPEAQSHVFAVVVNTLRIGSELSWKCIEESMGPYHYDCPTSIIDRLGEPTTGYAQTWRDNCRKRALRNAS